MPYWDFFLPLNADDQKLVDSASCLGTGRMMHFLRGKLIELGFVLVRKMSISQYNSAHVTETKNPDILVFYYPRYHQFIWLCDPSSLYRDRVLLNQWAQSANGHIKSVTLFLEAMATMEIFKDTKHPAYIPCDKIFLPLCHELRGHFLLCSVNHRKKDIVFFDPKQITAPLYFFLDVTLGNPIYPFFQAQGYHYRFDFSGQQALANPNLCGYFVIQKILATLGYEHTVIETLKMVKDMPYTEEWHPNSPDNCVVLITKHAAQLAIVNDNQFLAQWLCMQDSTLVTTVNPIDMINQTIRNMQTKCMDTLSQYLAQSATQVGELCQNQELEIAEFTQEILAIAIYLLQSKEIRTSFDLSSLYATIEEKLKKQFLSEQLTEKRRTVIDKILPSLIANVWLILMDAIFSRDLLRNCLQANNLKRLRHVLADYYLVSINLLNPMIFFAKWCSALTLQLLNNPYKMAEYWALGIFVQRHLKWGYAIADFVIPKIDATQSPTEKCLTVFGNLTPLPTSKNLVPAEMDIDDLVVVMQHEFCFTEQEAEEEFLNIEYAASPDAFFQELKSRVQECNEFAEVVSPVAP